MSDAGARQRIRSSLDESLLVEAAAGTGKTTVLVERLVAMLERGRADVASVVAVTFTRKAAGELKLRLRQALDQARVKAHGEERRNLEEAIARLEEARIGTIHSFCAELLRERPVEARVDPSFEELAEDESRALYARAFEGWIQNRLDEMSPGLRRALSRLALRASPFLEPPLERLREAGWVLVDWRDFPAPWRREPFAREEEIDRLVEKLDQLAELAVRGANPRDPLRQSLEPAVFLLTWIRRGEQAAPAGTPRDYDGIEARLLDLAGSLRRDRRKGSGRYGEALPREQVLRAREDFLAELEQLARRADADLAALLHGELLEVVELYEERKRAAGKLDFLDLLLRTRDLLRSEPAVRAHLQRRFSHVFVDEFQDTDPLQTEILLLLAAADPAISDWRESRPVPGKLFLVGDPKQSIYRFRRADVLLYEEVKEHLAAQGVGVVHLSQSFRAVAPIQRAINRAFAAEMTADRVAGRSDYIPLEEARRAHPGQPTLIALPPPEPYGWTRISRQRIEACLPDTVAAFVQWLLESSGWTVDDPHDPGQRTPLAPHHVCILFRRFVSWREDMTRGYTRALEARGVPHVLVGARTFHQREEVETIRTALAAIEWPDDELSVYATLRGSLFALPDDLLLRFRSQHGSLRPFRHRGEEVPPELGPVVEVLDLLARLHRRRNFRAVVQTVQELLSSARAHAAFALRPAGHQVLANVERICDLARSYELAGGLSFRGFVDKLNTEAERPGSGQAPVVEEGAAGVRLMTVHAAKGLEFPVVILADMTTRLARQQAQRAVDPERSLCAQSLLGWAPWDLLDRAEIERQRDEAEGVRVAYVAATRARDLLVVPAVGDGPLDGWLAPLNRALYPSAEDWRRSSPPAGCPPFADATVLQRPVEHDGRPEGSVRPGRHHQGDGDYDVIWWDPGTLDLNVEMNFGLGQDAILSEDEGGSVAVENRERYRRWQDAERGIREKGSTPDLEVLTVTELEDEPPGPKAVVRHEARTEHGARPAGPRFGTLVHTVLRDVALDAGRGTVEELVRLQGRLLDASRAEVEAAADAVTAALAHPLLERAREAAAEPGRCFREAPFLVPLDETRMLEGTVDLAFLEPEGWVVVDFKTDADLAERRPTYERQIGWYLFALERLTGTLGSGYLMEV